MTNNYVNFHQHTLYSLLDGAAKLKPLVGRAAELGMPGLATTEHGNVHGLMDFYEMCTKRVDDSEKYLDTSVPLVNPILGMEAYQARKTRFDRDEEEWSGGKGAGDELWKKSGPYHLTVVARNNVGYKNLIKLSSRAYTEGYYGKGRIDYELLSQHSDGLMVFSGCLNGAVQQALLREDFDAALKAATTYQDIVGKENFFIEIQDHGLEEQRKVKQDTIRIAGIIDAKVVPTCDAHYVHKEDADIHDLLLCVSTASNVDDEKRFRFHGPDFYLKSYDEMAGLFLPEWLHNSLDAAEQVDVKLEFGKLHFPDFPIDTGESSKEFLARQVYEGAKRRYGDNYPAEVASRIKYELGVIGENSFESYFLVVADLVNWAKSQKIRVGYGRGSAASSIVSYCLSITNIDPIRFGLLFERFLMEGRGDAPDIDLDFDDRYRERVIDYAREKYGRDHVSHICTFTSIGTRSAIRDAGRVLGYDIETVSRIAKATPKPVLGVAPTLQETMKNPDFRAIYDENKDNKKIVDAAFGLEGLIRQSGVHAAGVIIAKSDVTDFVPVMQKGEGEPIVSQFKDTWIAALGLLKIDFLGLTTLSVIDMAIENEAPFKTIEAAPRLEDGFIDLDKFTFENEGVYTELSQGRTVGTFQMESSGLVQLSAAIKPTKIEEIMAIIALYRPGPLGSNMDKMYIARKRGQENISSYHPLVDEILAPNYGLMLYQEDVLRVSQVLAGFTKQESDNLRKVIGKKLMKEIGAYREKFVKGCKATSGIQETLANKMYDDIMEFGGYGFNLCLTGDTMVKAPTRNMAIKDLVVPTELYAYDLDNVEFCIDTCEEVVDAGVQETFDIEFEDGSVVRGTLNHKFLCAHDKEYHTVEDIFKNQWDIVTMDSNITHSEDYANEKTTV